ncbi:MAG: hypothetical protein L6R48_23165 [Planctomycetes bacterium]|nr:hypothetical protein [Planctomycetota bacterium]
MPAAGPAVCPACRVAFEAIPFQPRPEPGRQPLPAGDAAPCAQHQRNRAEASCERCGVFMCAVCRIEVDGRRLCPPCFERLSGEGALPSAVVHRRNWCGMAFHLSFFSMVPLFGLPAVPAAWWIGIKGLRQNYRLGERISHAAGWTALVFATGGTLIQGLMVVSFVAMFAGKGR